jgi:uncharacterized protein YndB with AHSA1/START domain
MKTQERKMNEAIVEMNAGREIRISREFDAPRELVWKALTDPAHMGVWWGPDGFTTTTHSIDVRPGGSWVYTMHGPDGRDYPNAMTFREIVAPVRLAYRHGTTEEENPDEDFGTVVTLQDLGGGRTRVTLTSLFKDETAREIVVREYGAVEGGKQHLEKLADHLERMTAA